MSTAQTDSYLDLDPRRPRVEASVAMAMSVGAVSVCVGARGHVRGGEQQLLQLEEEEEEETVVTLTQWLRTLDCKVSIGPRFNGQKTFLKIDEYTCRQLSR